MSQSYYQNVWRETQDTLKKTLVQDAKAKKKGPYADANAAKWVIGHLFMSYVQIVNRLDECYDQMIHPQKREVIGRLLDMSLGRLLELKSDIVRIEMDDYYFFDNILIELKLTHDDMEIQIPKYFRRDQEKNKEHRRELIKQVFAEADKEKFRSEYLKDVPEEEKEEAWERYLAEEEHQRLEKQKFEEQQRKLGLATAEKSEKATKKSTVTEDVLEALLVIQRHERARQGRVQAVQAARNKALKVSGEPSVKIPDDVAQNSAKIIQRHWRRYRRRLQDAQKRKKIMEILGIVEPGFRDMSKFKKIDEVTKLRRALQDRNQKEYEDSFEPIKEKVTKFYSFHMEEDTVDEIIGWFQWFFDKSNFLPDYPPETPVIPTGDIMGIPKKLGPDFAEKAFPQSKKKGFAPPKPQKGNSLGIALAGISAIGGSALVVAGHWIGPTEFLICQKELEKRKKAGKSGDKKKLSKEEKQALKKKLKEQERKRLLAEEALGFQMKDSEFLVPLNKADRDYKVIWADMDESKNREQRYIKEFVQDEKCWELSMEVRKTVDDMMRVELEIFKDALERDKNPKKKKKKKKKPKGKKGGKKKKKKQKKDPTGDRTLDDLFMELYKNGIIRDYEEVRMKDYLGERSFGVFDMRQRDVDWPPSTGDVRELIIQLCILPLGSWRLHQLSPLIRSICLMGAENTGKEFLARVICTETASVMFDLTPENVAGKYPGKDGLKMLKHLVEKMSRALQPSVIFVNGAEKTFYKKVPKEEKGLEPKRLAGMIKKLAKNIKNSDQVLLLGVSSHPWMAKKKQFLKTYQKIILIPQMDYGSYFRLWKTLLAPYHSVPKNFDVSCLAKASTDYSVKSIAEAVKNVLTVERISRSSSEPYKQMEFLEELLKIKLEDEKMRTKLYKFYAGTEMAKKKAKRLAEIRQEKEKAKAKK